MRLQRIVQRALGNENKNAIKLLRKRGVNVIKMGLFTGPKRVILERPRKGVFRSDSAVNLVYSDLNKKKRVSIE